MKLGFQLKKKNRRNKYLTDTFKTQYDAKIHWKLCQRVAVFTNGSNKSAEPSKNTLMLYTKSLSK